jgi:GAF domain-containing protein
MDEAARLRALDELGILDTETEEIFDRITRAAARTFDVPMALISLVDRDRQWFKSQLGFDTSETDRSLSFCAHALGEPRPLVIEDARLDERFADNPQVTGPPNLRFYAGAQLRTKEGWDLGTLCVLDTEPRPAPSEEQLEILIDLAAATTVLMEQRRLALEFAGEVKARIEAEKRADEANAAKQEFFSKMNHDLRTPIGAILGFASFLMEDEDLDKEHKRDVQEIHRSGSQLLGLIDQLLGVARNGTPPQPDANPA